MSVSKKRVSIGSPYMTVSAAGGPSPTVSLDQAAAAAEKGAALPGLVARAGDETKKLPSLREQVETNARKK